MRAIITGRRSARRIGVIAAVLLPFHSVAQSLQSAVASYAGDSAAYSMAERGPDHCVWQKVSVAGTNQAGQAVYRTNQYTELGTGMSAWRNGQWIAASPDIEITATGAQATNGIHQLFFPATVASGGVDLLMPEAQHLATQLSGLSYFDPDSGTNLWIGLLEDAQGYLLPTNNSVLYPDVFNGGFRVDAIYENSLAGSEQNLILREQIPPPSAWGLSDDSCRLLAWTEILSAPEMRMDEQQLDDGTVVAKLIYFGQMFIGPGKAFLTDGDLSSTNKPILVDKQVVRSGARTFLVESLKYAAIAPSLATLPPPSGAGTNQHAGLRPVLLAGGKGQISGKGERRPAGLRRAEVASATQAGRQPYFGEVPPRVLARHSAARMQMVSLPLPKQGFLWDYSTLNFNTNALTLAADQTYLITSAVNVTNLSIEGGTVVKFAKWNGTNYSSLTAINTLNCLTSPYRPATFTGIDDKSIGEAIPSGTNAFTGKYAYPALAYISTNSTLSLQYLRVMNALQGIACYATNASMTNLQLVTCDPAIYWEAGKLNLYNTLACQITALVEADQYVNLNMQHVTVHNAQITVTIDHGGGTTTQTATNCLFVGIDYASPPFTMSTAFNFWTNDFSYVAFQTNGAGTHYLLPNSPFAAMGTTNVDTNLLAQIRRKTVWPPVVFGGSGAAAYFSNTNLVLSPLVQRDTGPAPSLGYHYDVIDDAFGDLFFTNATVTVTAGTVIGTYSAVTNGIGYGLGIGNGAQFLSTGSPTNLNRVVRYNMVQDQFVTNWSSASYGSILSSWITNTPVPVVNCRFTDFSAPAQDVWHFYGWSGNTSPLPFNFQDCQFHGGRFHSDYPTINLTNNLFERVNSSLYYGDGNVPYIRNNLFWGGTFDLALFGATNGVVRENLFDGTHIPDEGNTGYNGGYNAYNNSYGTNADRLTPTNATDVVLTNTFAYQTGPLSRFYYPTNDTNLSRLINAGSVTANQVMLYHFTTQTNEVKETNTVVDIGWHVVAVDTNGTPIDTDGGGVPDYIEDANGNGVQDTGETSVTNAVDDLPYLVVPGYLRCEYRQNPWGVNAPVPGTTTQKPRLYWTVSSGRRWQKQVAYEVLVASTQANLNANVGDMWDSGMVISDQTAHVEYNGKTLGSGMRLWWKVRSWEIYNDLPSAWSTNAFFQMGLLNSSDWSAKWLTTTSDPGSSVTPMYRKKFTQLTNQIVRATAYVTAKGVYELWIDGQRIGQNVLAPEWTDYNQRIQYQAFDVTTNLISANTDGTNHVVGGIVGEGWYSGVIAQDLNGHGAYTTGHDKQFLVQLVIEKNDATTNTVVTDNTWKCCSTGPIQTTSIYNGETYDARQEASIASWSTYLYTTTMESTYFTTLVTASDVVASQMTAQPDDPIQIVQYVTPVAMWNNINFAGTPVVIYDMGQNMVGWCSLLITNGSIGAINNVRYAELLLLNSSGFPTSNGNLYTNNLESARQLDTYITKDSSSEVFQPHFTYHGFRYVEVSGASSVLANLTLNSLTGCVIHGSSPIIGSFSCSNTNVNKLMTNILWTQRGNFMGISTDCPQRNERFGYGGDAQIFSQAACFNMDMAAFYTKFIRDYRDDQINTAGTTFGQYPFYAPFNGKFTTWPDIGWQIAGIILPWRLYENYGDTRFLAEHYLSMSNYMWFLSVTFPNYIDPNAGTTFGPVDCIPADWLSMDDFGSSPSLPSGWIGGSPGNYHTGVDGFGYECDFYAHASDLMAGMSLPLQQQALLQGNTASATIFGSNYTYYTNLAFVIRTNFFYQQSKLNIQTNSGGAITKIGNGAQGDFAFALYFNMVPSTQRVYCVQMMLTNTHRGYTNYYDLYGTPPLYTNIVSGGIQSAGREMLELNRDGYTSVAYQALTNLHFPQWLYSVTNGTPGVFQETTVSEHWNSYLSGSGGAYRGGENSFNHYAFGAVGEWIWKTASGISPDDNNTGYRNVIINPQPGGGVTNAFASVNTIRGPVITSWTNNTASNIFSLNVTNPANITSSVYFPIANPGGILESGSPATNATGVIYYQVTNGLTLFQLGSGGYSFTITNIVLGH